MFTTSNINVNAQLNILFQKPHQIEKKRQSAFTALQKLAQSSVFDEKCNACLALAHIYRDGLNHKGKKILVEKNEADAIAYYHEVIEHQQAKASLKQQAALALGELYHRQGQFALANSVFLAQCRDMPRAKAYLVRYAQTDYLKKAILEANSNSDFIESGKILEALQSIKQAGQLNLDTVHALSALLAHHLKNSRDLFKQDLYTLGSIAKRLKQNDSHDTAEAYLIYIEMLILAEKVGIKPKPAHLYDSYKTYEKHMKPGQTVSLSFANNPAVLIKSANILSNSNERDILEYAITLYEIALQTGQAHKFITPTELQGAIQNCRDKMDDLHNAVIRNTVPKTLSTDRDLYDSLTPKPPLEMHANPAYNAALQPKLQSQQDDKAQTTAEPLYAEIYDVLDPTTPPKAPPPPPPKQNHQLSSFLKQGAGPRWQSYTTVPANNSVLNVLHAQRSRSVHPDNEPDDQQNGNYGVSPETREASRRAHMTLSQKNETREKTDQRPDPTSSPPSSPSQ